MHIKQKAEDFQVEERTAWTGGTTGDFALYRLEKRGWTTPDAQKIIQSRWKLDGRRFSFGGLKDRHAETIQYFTIYRGPQRKLTHANLRVAYLGQVEKAYTSEQIEANRFVITVRALQKEQVGPALRALEEVRAAGVPNYYDDQRFGSVASAAGEGIPFVAKLILQGDHETALRTALTAPYAFERAPQKKEKAILRQHWGNWPYCQQALPRNPIVDFLAAHPADWIGALERLPPELRSLYVSAYQSHLWNRMLADWLVDHIPGHELIAINLRLGDVPMPIRLSAEMHREVAELQLPLHTSRNHLEIGDPRKPYFDRILEDEGLTLDQFKLKGFRKLFFSKGERAAWCFPRDLEARHARDEEHPGHEKLTLRFELPRGSYATLVVKRITRADLADD